MTNKKALEKARARSDWLCLENVEDIRNVCSTKFLRRCDVVNKHRCMNHLRCYLIHTQMMGFATMIRYRYKEGKQNEYRK